MNMSRLKVKRAIDKGRNLVKDKYDMSINDADEIRKISQNDWEKICNGFNYGYLQGYKDAMGKVKYNNLMVMGISVELHNHPELAEIIELYMELNEQDRKNILTYLKNAKKVRA